MYWFLCCLYRPLIVLVFNNFDAGDMRLKVALKEMLDRGSMPLPDVLMEDSSVHVDHKTYA